jgi:outer membrane protein assembly factor BamB
MRIVEQRWGAGGIAVNRLWNWRSVIVIACAAIVGGLLRRDAGVREVRRSSQPRIDQIINEAPSAADWPCWRGTAGNNIKSAESVPLNWCTRENIAWHRPIPGRGHSSPCIWGRRLYLSAADDEQQTISLFCLDKTTGSPVWQTELHRGGFMNCHPKNTHASSSPACDGRHVYVASSIKGSIWMSAVDPNGTIAWQSEAGPYQSEWGYGSSVALYESLVIVCGDHRGNSLDRWLGSSWIAALDRATGEIVWRVKRVQGDSFGSPIVAKVANRDQLLVAGKESVTSYDPVNGNVIWECGWKSKRTANSVAFDDQHVFASTRQPQPELICIRADGQGDVTQTHVVWRDTQSASDVPSPCVSDGRLFVMSDDGILTCRDSSDGRIRWKKRLGGTVSSSPLIAGGYLFCCNDEGRTFVLPVDGNGEITAENSLSDGILASPIISDGKLFIRTLTGLFCITPGSASLAGKQPQIEHRL